MSLGIDPPSKCVDPLRIDFLAEFPSPCPSDCRYLSRQLSGKCFTTPILPARDHSHIFLHPSSVSLQYFGEGFIHAGKKPVSQAPTYIDPYELLRGDKMYTNNEPELVPFGRFDPEDELS